MARGFVSGVGNKHYKEKQMTVQECADKKVSKIRRPSWPTGKHVELTFDPFGNLSSWGMLIETGEPQRRIDVVGLDFEDFIDASKH